jgi:hypothetical protein
LSDLGTNIYNPCNGSDCNIIPANRQQFPGNVIPTNLLSSQAVNLLKLIPLPNITTVSGAVPNYTASGQGTLNSDVFNIRVDRYQTEKLHLFGRYSFMQYGQQAPRRFGYAPESQLPAAGSAAPLRFATRASPMVWTTSFVQLARGFPVRILPTASS